MRTGFSDPSIALLSYFNLRQLFSVLQPRQVVLCTKGALTIMGGVVESLLITFKKSLDCYNVVGLSIREDKLLVDIV